MYRIGSYVVYTGPGPVIRHGAVGVIIQRSPITPHYKVRFGKGEMESWWLTQDTLRLADTELLRVLKNHL